MLHILKSAYDIGYYLIIENNRTAKTKNQGFYKNCLQGSGIHYLQKISIMNEAKRNMTKERVKQKRKLNGGK